MTPQYDYLLYYSFKLETKVIIEKSRSEVSLMKQDTIENVSFKVFKEKKYIFLDFILCQKCFHRLRCFF